MQFGFKCLRKMLEKNILPTDLRTMWTIYLIFIVKRKVLDWDDEKIMSPHQAYRVQTFTPPSGKIKISRARNAINNFINECFNSSGEIKDVEYPKSVSKWNCSYCPYGKDKELCGEGIIY